MQTDDAMKFATACPSCQQPAETTVVELEIPHFKKHILMSLACDHCGYKSSDVKASGAISQQGKRITLTVASVEDLAREVVKSDTAAIEIPDIELEMIEGSLGGVYTTVEGLMKMIHERLADAKPFACAHSTSTSIEERKNIKLDEETLKFSGVLTTIREMSEGRHMPFSFIISDPLDNSFIGPIPGDSLQLSQRTHDEGLEACHERRLDPGINVVEFQRTRDQNETLGLNDLDTEDYEK